MTTPLTFYEFFAGGGMARAGLGDRWRCLFANDVDPKKAAAYCENWGGDDFRLADVASLSPADLPGHADLAWASFPCQDLSLAGLGGGMGGQNSTSRSGAFWSFWRLMQGLAREDRAPRLIVLENVLGVLTSHRGADFAAIGQALASGGYRFGAVVADAKQFVPQSRPRVFIVATHIQVPAPAQGPDPAWHRETLIRAWDRLPAVSKRAWIWWRPSPPETPIRRLSDLIEQAEWDHPDTTADILSLMSPTQKTKLACRGHQGVLFGTAYRRTRSGVQRLEARFDGIAGCLRTPAGGSSRQTLLRVDGSDVRSRLLTAREAARLMGLPESYRLPTSYTDAYKLAGDGVCVPVVRHLAGSVLEPLLTTPLTVRAPRLQPNP